MRVLVLFGCLASLFAGCAPEGSSAYVSANIPLDEECLASDSSDVFLFAGTYDIARGGDYDSTRDSTYCQQSYYLHLIVNSNLKSNANDATGRAEPNVLQITDAEVRLVDIEQQLAIPFDGRTQLPNPFRVKANNTLPPTTGRDPQTGVVAVEGIPVGYDEQLGDYVDKQILLEVQLFGITTGDVEIDLKPFSFPVRICEGCLTACRSSFTAGASQADIYGDACPGHQDGRFCVDPSSGCTATPPVGDED